MRELIDSMATKDDPTRVFCLDTAESLGRCKEYDITTTDGGSILEVRFQGYETGRAGVTNEALLLILLDRTRLWSATGKTSQRIEDAKRHLGAALMLLRDDFNDPWPDLDGGGK